MGRLSENSVLNLKNKSHAVTADLVIPEGGGQGVIIAQGGAFVGWSLYLHDGRPKYCHNFAGLRRFYVAAGVQLDAGLDDRDHLITAEERVRVATAIQ